MRITAFVFLGVIALSAIGYLVVDGGAGSTALPSRGLEGFTEHPASPHVDLEELTTKRSAVLPSSENEKLDNPQDSAETVAIDRDEWVAGLERRYQDLSGSQLYEEARLLDRAYTRCKHETGMSILSSDPSSVVDVSDGVVESDWERIEYMNMGKDGRIYRVKISEDLYPDVYEFRREIKWVYAKSAEALKAEAAEAVRVR